MARAIAALACPAALAVLGAPIAQAEQAPEAPGSDLGPQPRLVESATDRAALEALYRATDGPEWRDRTNWLSAEPLADWYGVTTDSGGRITNLELRENGLSRTIPTELAQLSNLHVLDLRDHHLSGTIPSQLGSLTYLQVLDLSGNRLSGTIPSRLSSLGNLRELDLGFNQELTGTIAAGFRRLPLSALNLMATSACVTNDARFQEWLATIKFLPSGCGRPEAEVSEIDVAVFYTPAARSQ